jgi:hypothetical protein
MSHSGLKTKTAGRKALNINQTKLKGKLKMKNLTKKTKAILITTAVVIGLSSVYYVADMEYKKYQVRKAVEAFQIEMQAKQEAYEAERAAEQQREEEQAAKNQADAQTILDTISGGKYEQKQNYGTWTAWQYLENTTGEKIDSLTIEFEFQDKNHNVIDSDTVYVYDLYPNEKAKIEVTSFDEKAAFIVVQSVGVNRYDF